MELQEKINDQNIERSLWYIYHKNKIRKGIILLLIITSLFLFALSIYKFIKIRQLDLSLENYTYITDNIDLVAWRKNNQPKNLVIGNKNIIKLNNDNYDIVVDIKNPNSKIALERLDYRFVYNNKEFSEIKTTFILPNKNKKLIDFNVSLKAIKKVDIEIINKTWKRLNNYELENLPKNIFKIENEELILNQSLAEKTRNLAKFEAINLSPYSWLETKFYIFIYLGNKIVAVNQISTEDFKTGETRELQTSWFHKIPSYVKLIIEPEINILDSKNYITL